MPHRHTGAPASHSGTPQIIDSHSLDPAPRARKLSAVLRELADLLDAGDVLAAPSAVVWIDQRQSQLGRRKHINAVRALVAQGSPDARIVGRRHLLTAAAHEAELKRIGTQAVQRAEKQEDSDADMGEELGLRLVGGRR
jgi:hypothetical protein